MADTIREEILAGDPNKGALKEGTSVDELMESNILDPLTGAYNRRHLDKEINELINKGVGFTGIMIDVDHFKNIDDSLGHPAGDAVLKEVFRVVENLIRLTNGDLVARYGGDEFLVLIPHLTEEKVAEQRAEDIRSKVEQSRFRTKEKEVSLTVSVGVGVWRDGMDKEEFLDNLDKALLNAKTAGRNRVVVAKSS